MKCNLIVIDKNVIDPCLILSDQRQLSWRQSKRFSHVWCRSTQQIGYGNGKAAGMDGLTAEHLKNSHPIIFTILCKLFNQCWLIGWVSPAFGVSYTVPVPKGDARSRSLSASNFRGISINCILSKLFEMAILSRFSPYFKTSDVQFGFKKKLSCSHAIYSIRNIADHYIRGQSTVTLFCGP